MIRASTAKMLEYKKLWRCSKCKYQFIVEAEVELGYVCEKPTVCRNPISCNGKNFLLMSNGESQNLNTLLVDTTILKYIPLIAFIIVKKHFH